MGTRQGTLCTDKVSVVWFKTSMGRIFGRLILCALIITKSVWPDDAILSRYDALFLFCVALQYAMLRLGLETRDEAKLILIFHVTGTVMEIFKVWAGHGYIQKLLSSQSRVYLCFRFMYARSAPISCA